jgi:hypothetical protein
MTREEVIEKVLDGHDAGGDWLKAIGKRVVIASLPDGWGGHEGCSFLLAYKSMETGEVDKELVWYIHTDNDGNHGKGSDALDEDVVAKFDIDWDAGTALGPWCKIEYCVDR